MNRQQAGKRGIKAAIEKDPEHQAKAGRAGFSATVARHWQGDKDSYLAHQRKRANQAVQDARIDIDHKARLEAGEEIVSTELPVLIEPDDDHTFREMVSRSRRGRQVG